MKLGTSLLKVNESVVLCPIGGAASTQFGLVINILEQSEGKFALVCKLYRTKRFDTHYQAFRLTARDDDFHIVISPHNLKDFHVYCFHEPSFLLPELLPRDKFVVPRVELVNMLLPLCMTAADYAT